MDAEYVTPPMDIADAAATVKPSISLSEPATFQRVYYDFTAEVVEIRGSNGNDTFISDDSMAAMKVYGDRGNDNFLIGRVLNTVRIDYEDTLIDVVDGMDSATPGVSFNADFFGGRGDDYFEVNHNVGVLRMFGEAGDDMFFLKALLVLHDLVAVEADGGTLSAGAGDINGIKEAGDKDTLIDYIENNRIEIYGGSGFDTVVVAGTAIDDQFYIFTDNDGTQYFYGAGIKLENIDSIERIALLAGAGDDEVYLYGLTEEMNLIIHLGSGDDKIVVGGPSRTFEVTYPSSHAVYTIKQNIVRETTAKDLDTNDLLLNDILLVKRLSLIHI